MKSVSKVKKNISSIATLPNPQCCTPKLLLYCKTENMILLGKFVDSCCQMSWCGGGGYRHVPHGLRLGCWAMINRVKVINML